MDKVEFRKSVRKGTILRFQANRTRVGNTSITYLVEVFRQGDQESDANPAFSTSVTMVRVDDEGNKKPIED